MFSIPSDRQRFRCERPLGPVAGVGDTLRRSNNSCLQAVIKNADMAEDMQQDAIDCATQALEKYNIEMLGLSIARRQGPGSVARVWEGTLCPLVWITLSQNHHGAPGSFLFLVVRPGAPSSILAPSNARSP